MSDRETMGRLAQEAYSERLRKDRPSGWIAGWADYGPSGQEAWRCVAEALQQARDTAQAAQLRVTSNVYSAFASQLRNISCRIGPARLPESIRIEIDLLAQSYDVWAGKACAREESPAVKPAETIGPADDDALEIPLTGGERWRLTLKR